MTAEETSLAILRIDHALSTGEITAEQLAEVAPVIDRTGDEIDFPEYSEMADRS